MPNPDPRRLPTVRRPRSRAVLVPAGPPLPTTARRRDRLAALAAGVALVVAPAAVGAAHLPAAGAAPAVSASVAVAAAPASAAVAAAPAAASAGVGAGLRGVDVASHQHPGGAPIDWKQVASWGVDFVYVKATEGPGPAGTTYRNPYFAADWAGAGAAGLLRGAYHYARPRLPISTAVADAQELLATTGYFGGSADLPPVLDLEESGGLRGADVVAWASAWMTEINRQTGRWPMLYSAPWFLDGSIGGAGSLGDHPLWIADYGGAGYPVRMPSGWGRWTIWQFTPSASIPGIPAPVDLNAACDLRAYVQNPC